MPFLFGLPVGNQHITFGTTLGRLSSYEATTNSDGQATVTFTAGRDSHGHRKRR